MLKAPTFHSDSELVQLVDVKIEQPGLNLNQDPDKSNLSLKEKLHEWSPVQHLPTIYKLHNDLRNIASEAYEPSIIAIGPYHSRKENLKKMEIHKLAYLHSFLHRHNKSIEDYASIIGRLEPDARECYAEPITLNSNKFIEMLILDGCFIIELALRCSCCCIREKYDVIFSRNWVIRSVKRDLLLFENQIPFFILTELFPDENLVPILLHMYGYNSPMILPVKTPDDIGNLADIKHLLELFHRSLVVTYDESSEETPMCVDGKSLNFICSATSLAEYNVTFKKATESVSIFQIAFKNGSMQLPCLNVEDDSESHFRNLIAYEEYFPGKTNPVGDYVTFMDCLINTPEDVKLLTECGIVDNWLGSEKDVADMFNKLGQNVTMDQYGFVYKQQFKEVNEHCSRQCNRWMAKLKQNHFNSPWAIISIIAASVLLILTFLQTVFTVKN